jgi:hypothetical protein
MSDRQAKTTSVKENRKTAATLRSKNFSWLWRGQKGRPFLMRISFVITWTLSSLWDFQEGKKSLPMPNGNRTWKGTQAEMPPDITLNTGRHLASHDYPHFTVLKKTSTPCQRVPPGQLFLAGIPMRAETGRWCMLVSYAVKCYKIHGFFSTECAFINDAHNWFAGVSSIGPLSLNHY